jgi:hypothetical protein
MDVHIQDGVGIIGAHRLWIKVWTASQSRRITTANRGVTTGCPEADAEVSTAAPGTDGSAHTVLWTPSGLATCAFAGCPHNPRIL